MLRAVDEWLTMKAVMNLKEDAIGVLSTVRAQTSEAYQRTLARNLFSLITRTPRGDASVAALHAVWSQKLAPWDMRRIEAKVAYCLLEVDQLRLQLARKGSSKAVLAGLHEIELQSSIESFLRDNGAPKWGVPFCDVLDFERARQLIATEHDVSACQPSDVLDVGSLPRECR
ncbi:MAG TPA: hypothetical protein VFF69_14575 [Phycisphaerales bacterium]|nr:hypothetical protein [Phycisphaerales bacterium]